MTVYVEGPITYSDPIIVYQHGSGDSFFLRVPCYDGVKTVTAPLGALLDVSSATIKGVLRITTPDGSTDVTRDTSVSGEGAKADEDSDGTNDSFEFYVARTLVDAWVAGVHTWRVRYEDSSTTPATAVTIAIGKIKVVA